MLSNLKNVLVDEDGATLVEYALVVALIAVACITVIGTLGGQIQKNFTNITSQLGKA